MLSKIVNEAKHIGILFVLPIFLFAAGYWISDCRAQAEYADLANQYNSQHEEVAVATHKKVNSLQKALEEASDENVDLLSLVTELKDRPTEVKYITKTTTVFVPTDPVVITTTLPDEFIYKLEPGFPVALFAVDDSGYRFETYELKFQSTLVIADRSTAALLQVESSGDPGVVHEIPIDIQITEITEHKFFEPHIGLGITGSIPLSGALPTASGSIYTALLHPSNSIDTLGIRLSTDGKQGRLGIDAIGYNLGSKLPVFTDLWLNVGGSYGTNLQWSADLTLGSKL